MDEDLAAKQFDLLVSAAAAGRCCGPTGVPRLRTRITEIASLLEELATSRWCAAEMALILEVQTDECWQDVTLPMLETCPRRLRALVKLIEQEAARSVYTDFEDEIGRGADVAAAGLSPAGTDMERFRAQGAACSSSSTRTTSPSSSCGRNEPLTATDLAELERMFWRGRRGGRRGHRAGHGESEGGLGLFVRSLVGLDREAAKQAFAGFLAGEDAASANQIEFVDLIVDHLTERGVMEPRLLYESPFTDIGPLGVAERVSGRGCGKGCRDFDGRPATYCSVVVLGGERTRHRPGSRSSTPSSPEGHANSAQLGVALSTMLTPIPFSV